MLIAIVAAATAIAAPAASARPWTETQIDPNLPLSDMEVGYYAPDGIVAAYRATTPYVFGSTRGQIRAVIEPPGASDFLAPETLEVELSFLPAMDASWAGGAVAAWWENYRKQIRFAELPPGAEKFKRGVTLPQTSSSGFSAQTPYVAVGDSGAAVVVYSGDVGEDHSQVYAVYRPAGGEFGAPEEIGEPQRRYSAFARSVDVGADGTVAVGLTLEGRAHFAVRDPASGWGEPVPLDSHGQFTVPDVAVDGFGNVVAAVAILPASEETFVTGDIQVVFRSSTGELTFHDTGIPAESSDDLELEASALGEVFLAAESSVATSPNGGYLNGLHAAFGNSVHAMMGAEVAISETWGENLELAMNARGDAVFLYNLDGLVSRRREPLGSFGPAEDVIEAGNTSAGIDAAIDPFGNALGVWQDWGTDGSPYRFFVGRDGPLIDAEPPPVSEPGLPVPAVLAPDPPEIEEPAVVPPAQPSQPTIARPPRVQIDLSAEPQGGAVWLTARCMRACHLRIGGRVRGLGPLQPIESDLKAHRRLKFALRWLGRRSQLARAARRGASVLIEGDATDAAGNVTELSDRVKLGSR